MLKFKPVHGLDMDDTLLTVGILFVLMGLAGIYITFSGISETMRPLAEFSVLLLVLGVIMIPGGLFRGGIPQLSGPKVVVSLVVVVGLVSFVATTAAMGIGPWTPGPPEISGGPTPFNVTITIVPGSFNPTQAENYVPKEVSVVAGYNSTVIWVNAEEVPVGHTVTSDQGLFDSGLFGQGMSWTFTFIREGEYPYHCTPHPWMVGKVIVLPSSPSSAQPSS